MKHETAAVASNFLAVGQLVFSYGAKIFPVDPASKVPHIKEWQKRATDKYELLETWWGKWPAAMIGVATGAGSGFWCLDIDPDKGGLDSLRRLEATHGKLPDTARCRTAGGGFHCYFRWAGMAIKGRASDIAPGIDTRGGRADGSATGFVIAPPSVRADGRRYTWDGCEGFDKLADAPPWLLFLAAFNRGERRALEAVGITGPEGFDGAPPAAWQAKAAGLLKPAVDRPARLGGALVSDATAEVVKGYVRSAITKECEALAKATEGGRQSAIGNAALAAHSLLKGMELEGVEASDLEGWAFDQWTEARAALGDGEHTAEDPAERWERCRGDADPRDLEHVLDVAGFDDVSTAPELVEWERRRVASGKASPAAPAVPAGPLLVHPSDIRLDAILDRQAAALVKGILSPGDAAVSYGRSTAGKTFGVLDMAWHIACGKPDWHGRKVNKAPVLYVALEGVDGFDKRTLAALQVHGDPGVWFARLSIHVSLVKGKRGEQGAAAIVAAAKEIADKCGQPVGLVTIDTAARAMAGESQNDSEAVMAFVEDRMGAIARATGAAVMVVHHTNRGGDIRGALDWRAAMDVVLRWERDEPKEDDPVDVGQRRCSAEKVKDGPESVLFEFALEEVVLGRDRDGDPVTSCVVRSTPAAPKSARRKETKAQAVCREAFEAVSERLDGLSSVPLADVRSEFREAYPAGGERDPAKIAARERKAWSRAYDEPPLGLEIVKVKGVEVIRLKGATNPLDEFEAL